MPFIDHTKPINDSGLSNTSILVCPVCASKISVAGQRKLIERSRKEIELKTQQTWDFGDLIDLKSVVLSQCVQCGSKDGFSVQK